MNTTLLLSDSEMRLLGFTDHVPAHWYYSSRFDDRVSINFTISKETGEWTELVMNEDFGQPEYYMNMKPEWREKYMSAIDGKISVLRAAGLDVFVNHQEYGWEA